METIPSHISTKTENPPIQEIFLVPTMMCQTQHEDMKGEGVDFVLLQPQPRDKKEEIVDNFPNLLFPPEPSQQIKIKKEKVRINVGLPGEPGPPGDRGRDGKPGVVANNFTQYILKIVDPSMIHTVYQSANNKTFAGYSLVYLTDDNSYVENIELSNNSSINPTVLNFRITPNLGSRIAVAIINTVGCYNNTFPITNGSPGSNNSHQTVVSLDLQNGMYGGYVAIGAIFTITVRWC